MTPHELAYTVLAPIGLTLAGLAAVFTPELPAVAERMEVNTRKLRLLLRLHIATVVAFVVWVLYSAWLLIMINAR